MNIWGRAFYSILFLAFPEPCVRARARICSCIHMHAEYAHRYERSRDVFWRRNVCRVDVPPYATLLPSYPPTLCLRLSLSLCSIPSHFLLIIALHQPRINISDVRMDVLDIPSRWLYNERWYGIYRLMYKRKLTCILFSRLVIQIDKLKYIAFT